VNELLFLDTTVSSTGLAAGGDENNQWDWERNGNKTWLNLRVGIGINHWERKEVGLKKRPFLIHTGQD